MMRLSHKKEGEKDVLEAEGLVAIRNPPVCYRHLFQSTSWRFCWGCPAYRGFLFWAVFALFNSICELLRRGFSKVNFGFDIC